LSFGDSLIQFSYPALAYSELVPEIYESDLEIVNTLNERKQANNITVHEVGTAVP
jgi:hypothetical protein